MNVKFSSTLGNYEKILKLRNYSKNTINNYVHYVDRFLTEVDKSGLHITGKEIKEYVENFQYSSIAQQNMIYSSIKLFAEQYRKTLKTMFYFIRRETLTGCTAHPLSHLPKAFENSFTCLLDRESFVPLSTLQSVLLFSFYVIYLCSV